MNKAQSLMVLTGSGISAHSGLPTFRGTGGLWSDHRVEELASLEGFERDPELVWSWYNERRAAHQLAQPNAGHHAIAQLERRFTDFTLVTQNVDSLHLRAGSRRVLELHGSLREARCTHCSYNLLIESELVPEKIQHDCGGKLRPNIVWFGEPLPTEVWIAAVAAAARADVILVVGTSGMVYPAAALATHYAGNAFVAEINPEQTAVSNRCDVVLRGSAADILPQLVDALYSR